MIHKLGKYFRRDQRGRAGEGGEEGGLHKRLKFGRRIRFKEISLNMKTDLVKFELLKSYIHAYIELKKYQALYYLLAITIVCII